MNRKELAAMNELVLEGCRSVPLAAYLKALGVLRLVAEQADPAARGWWEGDRFRFRTKLNRDELARFFLCDYHPTPIIAPWNGRAGFLEGETEDGDVSDRTGAQLIRAYAAAGAPRFTELKRAVEAFSALPVVRELDTARANAKELAKNIGKRKPTDEEKARKSELDSKARRAKAQLLSQLRAEVAEDQFAWLDVCIRLAEQNANSPLLVAGGSDGSRDYGMAFGTALQKLFSFENGNPVEGVAGTWLRAALFGEATLLTDRDSLGHFEPGQGGYNATTGYEGYNPVNPWDMVIALEGAVLWSGGVTRRLDSIGDRSAASFPFSFNLSRAGSGQLSALDQNPAPGELWCPLWSRPVGVVELRTFFREGRLTLGKRTAGTGLEAALAVQLLGRSRGISSFVRVGLYQSDAKMPHTTATLGRYQVGTAPDIAFLALELVDHPWLAALRREARSKDVPRELQSIMRAIEDRLFEMASSSASNTHVQDVLTALGEAARLIAARPKLQEVLRPPPVLSRRWIEAADDGSREFRLALALAGLRARLKVGEEDKRAVTEEQRTTVKGSQLGLPMRAHLAPLDPETITRVSAWALKQPKAAEGRALAVWGTGSLVDNLCAVARRRLLEQNRHCWTDVPFDADLDGEHKVPVAVDSDEIAAFLDEDVRDDRVTELLLGLVWAEPGRLGGEGRVAPLPFAYAALKPLFTPNSVFEWLKKRDPSSGDIPNLPMPPALPSLLTAGRTQEAVRMAQERARASGLPTPFLGRDAWRDNRAPNPRFGRRLLAALIIPVRASVVGACLDQIYSNSDRERSHAA
jgi:CRISPR-associated protein Csx17